MNCVDTDGRALDFFIDVVCIAYSAWEVIKDPTNPNKWTALGVDVACMFIPGVTGGGTAVRAGIKYSDEAIAASAKTLNKLDNGADAVTKGSRSTETTIEHVKIHGNSLKSQKMNYGYALVDGNNEIIKFGEPINPKRRYTQKYLNEEGYKMKVLTSGNKADNHDWQHDMNMYYLNKYNVFPSGNKRGW